MDTNHFFSFSRIAMVMKREIIENWKKNLYAFIGLYAALRWLWWVICGE